MQAMHPQHQLSETTIRFLGYILTQYSDRLTDNVKSAAIDMMLTGIADGVWWSDWAEDEYLDDRAPYPVTVICMVRREGNAYELPAHNAPKIYREFLKHEADSRDPDTH